MANLLRGDITIEGLIMRLIAVVIALTVHEFAHGFVSYRLGDRTAQFDGRLSFNPMKHIDPIGFLLIVLVGFGWAKPVMVNPRNLRKPKRDMALISAAGPVSNFILAFVALLFMHPLLTLGIGLDWAIGGVFVMYYVIMFLITLIGMNIMLGVFNLLPLPPLDGSKILAVFLPNHLYWRYTGFHHGFIILLVLIIAPGNILGRILSPFIGVIYLGLYTLVRWIYFFL